MSWLFSQALVAASSLDTCSDGTPSAQLNVMPTPHRFWRNDKTMEPSDHSRFGLTCRVLTADHGEVLLMWCREASRARTSAWPARAPASTASGQACGSTWRASLARFDPSSSTWRTAQQSLLGDSEESSVTWPRSGMTAGGQCWELIVSVPPMSENASGSWPTPTASLGTKGGRVTPRKSREGGTLIEAVSARTYATPMARDWRSGKASGATMARNSRPLSEQIGGLLNPNWVEWLMGWPIGWTVLRPSETVKSPSARQRRSVRSQQPSTEVMA